MARFAGRIPVYKMDFWSEVLSSQPFAKLKKPTPLHVRSHGEQGEARRQALLFRLPHAAASPKPTSEYG